MKQMTPKEKGQFLIKYFQNERGSIELNDVDLSGFKGNVIIDGWKVGGNLYQDGQEVGGSLIQTNQQVGGVLFQDEKKKKQSATYTKTGRKPKTGASWLSLITSPITKR